MCLFHCIQNGIQKLKEENGRLKKELEHLKGEYERLRKENGRLKGENDRQKEEIGRLRKEMGQAEMKGRVSESENIRLHQGQKPPLSRLDNIQDKKVEFVC